MMSKTVLSRIRPCLKPAWLVGLLCISTLSAWATGTVYVSLDGTHSSPYDTWETAATNIHTAVDYACANLSSYDTVLVSPGTYYAPESAGIRITNALTVKSQNGREATLVHGGGLTNDIFFINHSNAVLDGFTITNGPQRGVYLSNGTVQNCAIVSNRIGGNDKNGAGIYMLAGTVQDSIISNNVCGYLGGGINYSGAAGQGQVIRCQIMNNRVYPYSGGGVYGKVIMRNCLIANNSCGSGNNGNGGGVNEPYLINCTVVSNYAANLGGGTRNSYLTNCIVYFNTDKYGNNMSEDAAVYTCSDPLPAGTGNIDEDPLFVDWQNGDYRLSDNSPARGAGTTNGVSDTVDLAGWKRISGGQIDMGAYQWAPPAGTLISFY